jgi:hypothetical protein
MFLSAASSGSFTTTLGVVSVVMFCCGPFFVTEESPAVLIWADAEAALRGI